MTDNQYIENVVRVERLGEEYHNKFSLIKSSPKEIYYLGDINLLDRSMLAIVGSRDHSEYATQVISKLFDHIPEYDLVTVSGMAYGIDQLAHRLSIKNNIPTIAVIGSGIGRYLKSINGPKIKRIIETGGLVISEYPLDMAPTKYSFPQRNRIIAGLGDVLFLPEARLGSGSLITVDFALKTNKPVYTTPNNIFAETSSGTHKLLGDGKIKAVFNISDFLDKNFKKI